MEYQIDYATMQARHPEAVAEVMEKLSKSTSKEKGRKPEELRWSYSWSTEITGRDKNTVEDIIRRSRFSVQGRAGRWWGYATADVPCPPEIRKQLEDRIEKDRKEQERIDSLTPEQREAEVQDILSQLNGTPGFFHFKL